MADIFVPEDFAAWQIHLRRMFHRRPEIGWCEYWTTSALASECRKMGLAPLVGREIMEDEGRLGLPDAGTRADAAKAALTEEEGIPGADPAILDRMGACTGALVDLAPDREPGLVIRCDIDALPVRECGSVTHLPHASGFDSLKDGWCHACGHDGHMAMVLGLARRLAAGEVRPQRNVLLIFEPAEETTGGAAPICATGLLERYHVTRVFGMHLWPELPAGVIASRAGAMMSRSCELTVEITGRSVHLARFAEGCDALDAAARLLTRLYALAEGKPCLLRFGKMESGSARNAVSDHTHLEGSLRCLDDGLYAALWERAQAIGRAVGEETGCTVTMTCSSGYPPVTNDAALLAEVRERFPIAEAETTCITEDFSEYQRHAPGVFFFLGTGGIELHAPTFTFPEEILDKGEALLCGLV